MFGLLSDLRNLLLAAAAALLVGLAGGVYLGKRIYDVVPASDVKALQVEVVKSVEDTAKAEVKLEAKRDEVRTQVKVITKEIVKYVPATPVPSPQSPAVVDAADPGGACRLSVAAVGLLNAARTGADVQSAADLDAQSQTDTNVGLRELSEADIDLAGQYRELAADHDALVEYVEQYQDRLKQHLR